MSEVKVPEGYKQTEVEVIPEDWKVTTIGDFAPLQRGFDLPTTKVEAGDYPVVYSNGIVRNHKDFQVKGAGIVTGRSGTIGKVHYIESDFWPHNTTLWVTSFGDAHVKFVYYLFKYIGFERFKSGSGVPTLNRNDAHSFKITVPTKVDEQTAIATALSDVDNLIGSLEKLIAKKEAIKTGTMQQLLTGKTRLPEFATREDGSAKGFKQTELGRIPEDWEVSPMRALTTLMTNGFVGTAKSHYTDASDGVLYIQGYNVKENSFNFHGIKRVTQSFHIKNSKSCLQTGDVLMVQTGDVGMTTIVPPELENSNCHALIINRFKKSINPKYFSYYFNSSKGRSRLKEIEVGTTMKHINVGNLLDFQVPYPCLEEQTAIATILSDMDTEIQALQQRLEKTRDIKQGMMQQLLTGKVRLTH
ncbi:restriction endonuclease subunit S [Psychrobacter sp. Ps7]|uniref:restriction endonuclease subunit S n=1 Tax=Psychrobacter sp. Ps7 TaxID=2790961 RepID=UPI001EDD942E|nr:restriction endonuclease subunit S [Psychrobacter sp. Ps7]MCG3872816.1 restriction endonuclease subunit S [Psychrobacter sp. Ps7]